MIAITKKQKEVFDFLKVYINKNGYSPSIKEICDHFGTTSLSTMNKLLSTLDKKGLIKKTPRKKRSIELVDRENTQMNMTEVTGKQSTNSTLLTLILKKV